MTSNLTICAVFAAVGDVIAILVTITRPVDGAFIIAAPHLAAAKDLPSAGLSPRYVNVGHRWPVRSLQQPALPPAVRTTLQLSPVPPMEAVGILGRGSHSLRSETILFLDDTGGHQDEEESDQGNRDNGTKTAHDAIHDDTGTGGNDKKGTVMSKVTYALIVGIIVTGAILVSSSPSDASLLPLIAKSSGLIIAGIVSIVIAEFGCNGQSMFLPQGPKFQSMATTFSDWRNLATVYAVIASLIAGVISFSMSQDAIGLEASIRKEDQELAALIRKEDQAMAALIRKEDRWVHQKERLDDHKERMGDRVAAGIVVALAAIARNEDKVERQQDKVERRMEQLEDKISALHSDRRSTLLPWERAAIDQEINTASAKLEKLRKKHNLEE
jgi:hypothetical protein